MESNARYVPEVTGIESPKLRPSYQSARSNRQIDFEATGALYSSIEARTDGGLFRPKWNSLFFWEQHFLGGQFFE
jgi:hypothetical protein